jgi:hypothetical protein
MAQRTGDVSRDFVMVLLESLGLQQSGQPNFFQSLLTQ